jgi:hypothetical protein
MEKTNAVRDVCPVNDTAVLLKNTLFYPLSLILFWDLPILMAVDSIGADERSCGCTISSGR